MDQTDVWVDIVTEALQKGLLLSMGAVPGAKLRELIAESARKHGLAYPPAESSNEKFGDFLKRFDSVLIVWRREGQDFLVAPVDKPELLADVQAVRPARLRDDIFEAFTRVPYEDPPKYPWYDTQTDTVKWLVVDESQPIPQLVKMPSPSQSEEVEQRRAFANSPQLADHKDSLLSTLSNHPALWAFSKAIKERGLGRKWHLYRFQLIVLRLKQWCASEHVEWRDEWIGQAPPRAVWTKFGQTADTLGDQRKLFEKVIEMLGEEDLRRISVPLDIVLKLIKP
jgi:hypothetical protein